MSLLLLTAPVLPSNCTPEQVDSYCALYTKVIQERGDGTSMAKASPGVKRRTLLNDQLYLRVCPQAKV